jgi:hypothetical protein
MYDGFAPSAFGIAPSKGVVPKACRILNSRVSAGIQGVINGYIGTTKVVDGLLGSLASVAASGPTGGASLVGLPGSAYLAIGGTGQVLTSGGQLLYAATGNSQQSDPIIQNGSILSGPVFGVGALALTGDKSVAAQLGSLESVLSAGPGFVDRAVSAVGALAGFCPP